MTFKINNLMYNFYLILIYFLNIIYFLMENNRLGNMINFDVDTKYNVKFM